MTLCCLLPFPNAWDGHPRVQVCGVSNCNLGSELVLNSVSIATTVPLASNDGAALFWNHKFTLIVLDLTSLFVIVHLSASVRFLDDMIFVVIVAGAAVFFSFCLILVAKRKMETGKYRRPEEQKAQESTEGSHEHLLDTKRGGALWEPNDCLSCRSQALWPPCPRHSLLTILSQYQAGLPGMCFSVTCGAAQMTSGTYNVLYTPKGMKFLVGMGLINYKNRVV